MANFIQYANYCITYLLFQKLSSLLYPKLLNNDFI